MLADNSSQFIASVERRYEVCSLPADAIPDIAAEKVLEDAMQTSIRVLSANKTPAACLQLRLKDEFPVTVARLFLIAE